MTKGLNRDAASFGAVTAATVLTLGLESSAALLDNVRRINLAVVLHAEEGEHEHD